MFAFSAVAPSSKPSSVRLGTMVDFARKNAEIVVLARSSKHSRTEKYNAIPAEREAGKERAPSHEKLDSTGDHGSRPSRDGGNEVAFTGEVAVTDVSELLERLCLSNKVSALQGIEGSCFRNSFAR
jgi:hypothetical protein